ncbi:MAG TPA: aconitate hydratase AcnA [Steroidobacteraceae bacterium]|nr:aconitate hydratase AcnA [Steroidobacteraceae bacterium]
MELAGRQHQIADIVAFGGATLRRLPVVLRILLENSLRHSAGDLSSSHAILDWARTGTSNAEIPFHPGRLLMHDTTCVPALVDIAAMRSAVAESGRDPSVLNPVLPIDVSVDHSIAVDYYGTPDALRLNMTREIERNSERYRLLKWATRSLRNVRVHPPGTGIMHTMNLERLATVVSLDDADGGWAFPDTLIGTDSHTPMINGIGVLAWGVGGLEAESVMFGMPVMLKIPEVVGVRMTGHLPEGTLATDLVLEVTQRLRALPLSGKFVEFFGPGVTTLSCGERAVVANMAPEYGASCGFFAVDQQTLEYLRATGRPDSLIRAVEAYCKRQQLWFEDDAEPRYSEVVEIDLAAVEVSLAGPRRPQDRLTPRGTRAALGRSSPAGSARGGGGHRFGDAMAIPGANVGGGGATAIPGTGAVAIAAITSCTNTSDPRLVVAAALLARKARALGLQPQPWVKTSLAPGSPAAELYLRRANLLEDLESLGFGIVGYGCTTCIGNSGPLAPDMMAAIEERAMTPVAVLSGNRNFPGRVHPLIEASFLASPPLVVAYALAGDVDRDITTDPIGQSADGRMIYLRDLWPTGVEIDAAVAASVTPADFSEAYQAAEDNEIWRNLDAPSAPLFPWDDKSTYIRRPPFASAENATRLGSYVAHPLLVLGDDITTDHISPAGQVPAGSDAAEYLVARGENAKDLNVFAARRGNWEAMLRGLFINSSVRNLLAPNIPPGSTIHAGSGAVLPLRLAAECYQADQESVVVIAGERYGTGSSRDWAAKGLWLLGVRAVLALSFERIHRSNLIGMGILPIVLRGPLVLTVGDTIAIDGEPASITPRANVSMLIQRSSGKTESLTAAVAVETALEVALLKDGGILPHILRRISKEAAHS